MEYLYAIFAIAGIIIGWAGIVVYRSRLDMKALEEARDAERREWMAKESLYPHARQSVTEWPFENKPK